MANIFELNRPNNKITLGTTDTTINVASHTASLLLSLDASKDLESVTDLTSWITGTANQITVTDDTDGTLTLSTPQDIHTGASPTLAGLTVTGNCVFGLNSSVFQPTTDSTTFFQVLDADGGTPILNIDSTNERVGIGTASPTNKFFIETSMNDTLSIANSALSIFDSVGTAGLFMQQRNADPYGFAFQAGNTSETAQFPILLNPLGGNVGIGTVSPAEKLDIDGDAIRIRTAQTPASASATGTQGMICWDADYIYVCTATDTWKRIAIATW